MSVQSSNPETNSEDQQDAVAPQQPAPQQKTTRSSRRDRKSASAFRTISEVAEILDVQQHVLRFWETKFSQVRPLKRGGGRRYYRPEDVALLQSIHHLLYTEGYTIKGVQKLLREKGKNSVVQNNAPEEQPAASQPAAQAAAPVQPQAQASAASEESLPLKSKQALESVLQELKELKGSLFSEG